MLLLHLDNGKKIKRKGELLHKEFWESVAHLGSVSRAERVAERVWTELGCHVTRECVSKHVAESVCQ